VDRGLTGYGKALESLFARTGATSKYGLERTIGFLAKLGNPHDRIRTIHVAGTNGKGSVVALLYALLRDKGLRVGRYTSPHLVDFRERIVVDDVPVTEEYIVSFLDRWQEEAERIGATFFEITTAMAFQHFADQNVDVAVIETGLGGRLDATNVIRPIVAGITSISIDHTEYLGTTEEQIAREKAGIFKPGIPAVIGSMSLNAWASIVEAATKAGVAGVIEATREYPTRDVTVALDSTSFTMTHRGVERKLSSGLIGSAQAGNAAVAMTMLDAAGPDFRVTLDRAAEVLPRVQLAGRFQRIGNYILDVAHNADGMRLLASTLATVSPPGPVTAVLGVMTDKDWRQMLGFLAPRVDQFVIVAAPSAPRGRAWNVDDALAFAQAQGMKAVIDSDFVHAVTAGRGSTGTFVITGSFHTVGDALQVLGASPLT
jgi:dihydrofolate synthase/folylpolyglutamate synthase